jgi:hypothetical protein
MIKAFKTVLDQAGLSVVKSLPMEISTASKSRIKYLTMAGMFFIRIPSPPEHLETGAQVKNTTGH